MGREPAAVAFEKMAAFASFGFPKSHAVAFALLAVGAATHGAGTPRPLIGAPWIVAALTLLTVGEVVVRRALAWVTAIR